MLSWQGLFLPIITNTLLSHSNEPSPQTERYINRLAKARIFRGYLRQLCTSWTLLFCRLSYSRKEWKDYTSKWVKWLNTSNMMVSTWNHCWVQYVQETLKSVNIAFPARRHPAPGTKLALFQEATFNPSAWAHSWILFIIYSVIRTWVSQ